MSIFKYTLKAINLIYTIDMCLDIWIMLMRELRKKPKNNYK
jgi:hypothetical protein